jgi:NAD(P)-dependent dehydrogenase (short-subunit alcohol dehydrogenase family)
VNIVSLGGVRGRPDRHTYIASKQCVVGLTKSIALEGNRVQRSGKRDCAGAGRHAWRKDSFDEHMAAGGSEISFEVKPDAVAWRRCFWPPESINITGVVLPWMPASSRDPSKRGPLKFPQR